MLEALSGLSGALIGFTICYLVFVDHFAAAIEARVRKAVADEKNKFFGGVAAIRKDVASAGQGAATKIADESSKL